MTIEETKIAIVYHSGYGHTEVVAQEVERGAREAGAETSLIKISPEGKIEDADWNVLDAANAIIFGSPTYMGMVSGPFKMFADVSSKRWFTMAWKDKLSGGFTSSHSLSGDKLSTLQYLSVLAAQHGMIWISTGIAPADGEGHTRNPDKINRLGSALGVMAQTENAPPAESPPQGDKDFAAAYGQRIAGLAARFNG